MSRLEFSTEENSPSASRRQGANTILFSLTAICFLFGGLLAFGVRSIEAVRENRADETESTKIRQGQLEIAQKAAEKQKIERDKITNAYNVLKAKVASDGKMSAAQLKKLSLDMKKLQALLGLTPIEGPGIVIRLADNPNAANAAGPDAGPFLPGIVHDFDLLQVVNELRSARAEAIAINGVRITGFTPIRCVGPVIHINYDAKPAPFKVEAIGNADDMENAVNMPGGILESLKNQTLRISVEQRRSLSLPPAEGMPQLKAGKPQ